MSNDRDLETAWIPVPSAEGLHAEAADAIRDVSDAIGFVPNIARLLGVTPRHCVAWWRYFDELMRGPVEVDQDSAGDDRRGRFG